MAPLSEKGTQLPILIEPGKNGSEGKMVRTGGITAFQAFVNLFKAMVGAGVLSLPLAFKQSGLWCGCVMMVLFGATTYYSYQKLVRCSQFLTRKYNFHSLDYGGMAEESFKTSFRPIRRFSKFARYFVNFSIFLMQIGTSSAYFVFVKEHLAEILNHIFPHNSLTKWTISLICLVAFTLLCLIRHIRSISYVSLVGSVVMVVSLAIILQQLVREDHITSELPALEGVGGAILAAGSILYAYEGQTMILPLENKMKYPHKMMGVTGVLFLGCAVVTLVNFVCGFLGYITYGKEVRGSIALNLPNTPLFFAVKIMLTFVVFSSYLVQMYVIIDMIWPAIEKRLAKGFVGKYTLDAELIFRTFLVFLTFGIATGIPDLDNIIPLVGVTAGMLLALIIPSIIDTTTFLPGYLERKEYGTLTVHMFLNTVIFVAGVFFLITGTITNMKNVINGSKEE